MFILPQHLNSPLAFCGVRFAQSLVLFCVLLIIVCIFVLFFSELCLNSSTIHTQNARNVLRNIIDVIGSRKSIKDIQYYVKKRKEQKYKQ
jgi:hypothetical protein